MLHELAWHCRFAYSREKHQNYVHFHISQSEKNVFEENWALHAIKPQLLDHETLWRRSRDVRAIGNSLKTHPEMCCPWVKQG